MRFSGNLGLLGWFMPAKNHMMMMKGLSLKAEVSRTVTLLRTVKIA